MPLTLANGDSENDMQLALMELQGQYAAERAATQAVVLARAHLERYREQVDPADLGAAREALGSVRATVLDPRTSLEYQLALGQALFLEDEFGAAANLFATAVPPARLVIAVQSG